MTSLAPGAEDIFLVLVGGKPGREAAYDRWFTTSHMADMRGLPGVASAHAFRLDDGRPADLCAVYEFADGGAVLETIGRSKGTPALPHSEDQGAMTWRLYETAACRPQGPAPAGADLVVVLLKTPREAVPAARLAEAVGVLAACPGRYVRALALSPLQPARGSEFGAALLVAGADRTAVAEALDRHLPGVAHDLFLARAAGPA